MPQPEQKRKRLPQAERRETILEAAGALFGERGYDATRLDDVAAALGVTKPVLYRHFASKKELYIALLERHQQDLTSFIGVMPAEGTLAERLRPVVERWLDYVEAHAYSWQMLFRDSGGGAEIQARRNQVHDRARAVLADIISMLAPDSISADERAALAEMLSMGMASLVLWWTEQRAVPREAVVSAIVRVWTGFLESAG